MKVKDMDLLKQICEELGRECPDELPDVLVNVHSDFKIRRWVIRNCAVAEIKKTKEVKVNVEEKPTKATNKSKVSISIEEE